MRKYSIVVLLLVVVLLGIYGFQIGVIGNSKADLAKLQQSQTIDFEVDTVVTGLTSPWGMAWLSNGDMLISDKIGELRILRDGKLLPEKVKGLPEIYVRGQGGLMDIELHPRYEENGWIYISYSTNEGSKGDGGHTALMRAKLKENELIDKQVLFKATPNTTKGQHFGSRIEFDREGFLYLSIGERGEQDLAQKLNTYNGKILRFHDDGRIPADNPFINTEGAIKSVYSYGHRNPQGLALHPETGELWETEHGPRGGDEINIVKKGANYGWPVITYGINYNGTIITKDTVMEGMEQPVMFWRPSIAPCGMTFVTSDKYPEWNGNILVGSLRFMYLERCELDGKKVVNREKLLEGIGRVRNVRQGPDGFIYVAIEGNGMIVRLVPA